MTDDIRGKENLQNAFKDLYDNNIDELDVYSDFNPDDFEDYIPPKKKRRWLSIAVAAVCVIVLSSVIGIGISNGAAQAVMEGASNTIHRLKGDEHMISNKEYSLKIDSLSDKKKMKIAKEMMPNLIVDEKILNSYSFKEMEMSRYVYEDQSEVIANIFYQNEDNQTLSFIQSHSSNQIPYNYINVTYVEQTKYGDICISEDYLGDKGYTSLGYEEGLDRIDIAGYATSEDLLAYVKQNVVGKF